MHIFVRVVVPALTPILLGFFLTYIDRSNGKELMNQLTKERIVIRLPKAYLWIGCLDISFFVTCLVLMALFPNHTATVWVWAVFLLLTFMGAVIVVKTQTWQIVVFRSENYFLYRGWLFKTYKIPFSDCMHYKCGTNTLILKTKERIIRVDIHATNFEFFMAMLAQHKVTQIK